MSKNGDALRSTADSLADAIEKPWTAEIHSLSWDAIKMLRSEAAREDAMNAAVSAGLPALIGVKA